MKLDVRTLDAAASGDIELNDAVFGKEARGRYPPSRRHVAA